MRGVRGEKRDGEEGRGWMGEGERGGVRED